MGGDFVLSSPKKTCENDSFFLMTNTCSVYVCVRIKCKHQISLLINEIYPIYIDKRKIFLEFFFTNSNDD